MQRTILTALALAALAADCSTPDAPASATLDAHHPANPGALEAPEYARSSALDGAAAPAQRAATPAHGDATPAEGAQLLTCPMHPEIVTSVAGRCPVCGMQLVPKEERP